MTELYNNMDKNSIERKVEMILRKSKNPLDQVEIAEKINENPFVVSKILHQFQEEGKVIVENN